MGRRRKPKPPDISFLNENSLPRYVSTDFICEKYEISNVQCKEMARAAGAFYEIRKASLIDRIVFEDVYKGQLRERKRQQKVELVKEQLKSYEPVTKEYMRYQEAADYFSMSLTCFKALAKEAKAVRRIGGVTLVNVDLIIEYIELNFGGV